MADSAKLSFDDQTIDLPMVEGTEGERAFDLTPLRSKAGLMTLDLGLDSTGMCESGITFVDGEAGVLRYRGIPIEVLAKRSNFVETSFLLVRGHLPTQSELDVFQKRLTDEGALHESFKYHFEGFPIDAPPMAILSSMVNTLSCFYPRSRDSDADPLGEEEICLLSKVRTIAAHSHRRSMGLPFIYTDPRLSYGADFLHMMFSRPYEEYIASETIVDALNLLLVLHADHEMGGSTTTVRVVGSSKANLFASCAAGIGSLWGEVHGGATVAVIQMLEAIHRGEADIDQLIARAKDKQAGFRLPGFGHRIYKTIDPRSVILKDAAGALLDKLGRTDPLFDLARKLEDRVINDPYFVDHRLFTNADFYNGIIMRAIGIPQNMFTVVFAIGRMPGWIAHWKEQTANLSFRIIRPRQLYKGPHETAYVPIEERRS